ncbi:hypothetical protein [Anaerostipes sp.]|uniref:hypothetical protein n=1 Tax=Anaerostipes sp. TaxID=1872530 RepID=UPI00257C6D49|nr:hypothetical protein [Anaerostipes sp.]MBS6278234.1 hypothetical protein [Anaerostipes sp.]
MEAIITAITNALKGVSDQAMEAVGTVIPYAFPFVAIGLVVGIIVKIFKKLLLNKYTFFGRTCTVCPFLERRKIHEAKTFYPHTLHDALFYDSDNIV